MQAFSPVTTAFGMLVILYFAVIAGVVGISALINRNK